MTSFQQKGYVRRSARVKVNEKLPYWKVNKRLVEFTHTFLDMKVWYPSIVSSYIYGVGVEQITYSLGLGKFLYPTQNISILSSDFVGFSQLLRLAPKR